MQKQNKKVKCEVFTRVCGYYRPINNFNEGKQQEYDNRVDYNIREDTCSNEEQEVGMDKILHDLDNRTAVVFVKARNCSRCKEVLKILESKPNLAKKIYKISTDNSESSRHVYRIIQNYSHDLKDSNLPIIISCDDSRSISSGDMEEINKVFDDFGLFSK